MEPLKKEAEKSGITMSEVISVWARVGRKEMKAKSKNKKPFTPVNLGEQLINLDKRSDWNDVAEVAQVELPDMRGNDIFNAQIAVALK